MKKIRPCTVFFSTGAGDYFCSVTIALIQKLMKKDL